MDLTWMPKAPEGMQLPARHPARVITLSEGRIIDAP